MLAALARGGVPPVLRVSQEILAVDHGVYYRCLFPKFGRSSSWPPCFELSVEKTAFDGDVIVLLANMGSY